MGETLIESSHPNCIRIQLSSFSDDRKQQNKEVLYDWSHADKNISSACDKCHLGSCKIATTVVDDKGKVPITNVDSSAINNTCANFLPKTGSNVYNDRRNSSAILSEGDATEKSKESFCCQSSISSEDHNLRRFMDGSDITVPFHANLRDIVEDENAFDDQIHHLKSQESDLKSETFIQKIESDPNSVHNNISAEGYKACSKSSVTYSRQAELEHNSIGNDSCSSSKSNNGCDLDFRNNKAGDHGECSSSGNIVGELDKFASVKEMCIFFLRSNGLLGGSCENITCAPHEILGQETQDSAKSSQLCQACGHAGSPLKMLICDLCEEAFHISCCTPKVRKLPVDDWYCHPCSKKMPKAPFGDKPEGQSSGNSRRLLYCDKNPIQLMLTDSRPYTTAVRIGKDFQAEVPEWSGPIHSDFDASEEPSKIDPAEYSNLNDWRYGKRKKSSSVGNWVQCREVIFGNDDGEGTVCGKWRRAPLFVVQTDDWDCSCALPWDPIHADCAVPQELETDEVLRHLKYIEMLKPQMPSKKQKTGSSQKW